MPKEVDPCGQRSRLPWAASERTLHVEQVTIEPALTSKICQGAGVVRGDRKRVGCLFRRSGPGYRRRKSAEQEPQNILFSAPFKDSEARVNRFELRVSPCRDLHCPEHLDSLSVSSGDPSRRWDGYPVVREARGGSETSRQYHRRA